MKKFLIPVLTLALCTLGATSATAQIKLNKEAIQAAIQKQQAEKGESDTGARRRGGSGGGAGGGGGSDDGARGWKALKNQWANRPKQKKKSGPTGWSALRAGAAGGAAGTAKRSVESAIDKIIKKQITVIAGNRVTDAITGELLDDAREIRVDEDKKDEYYDDGTHGDLVAGDGQYTRVEEITGVIGPDNQRIKERLIQALYEISRLDAREFYGYTLMSTDHSTRPERNVRWALVDPPEDRVGFRLSEIATEKSVEVPDFWAEEMSRDMKIAGPNGWARSFLDEYRVEKGGLTSNFYMPYVPQPPTIPKAPPPEAQGWTPFMAEYDEENPDQVAAGGGGGGGQSGGGMTAKAQAAAAKFLNRGAGAGSTSGGYFSGQ